MLQRPIFGGVFGMGQYALATIPLVSNGLHAVQFMVIEPYAGSVLSVSEDKREALAAARRLLRASDSLSDEAEQRKHGIQAPLWPEEILPTPRQAADQPKSISRRRREIFEKCGGSCHYCRRTLRLDGSWHIEHMVPKALNGGDGFTNLVASCPACNLSKRDRTAVEFLASRPYGKGYRESANDPHP